MTAMLRHPLFWLGLAIRAALLGFVAPQAASQWYVPFMAHSVQAFSLDPWTAYLEAGGDPQSFPYGYPMWLLFLPLVALALLAGMPVLLAYGATLAAVDLAVLWMLQRLLATSVRSLLILWWLSPIVLFATYWMGLNDLVPVALMVAGLVLLKRRRSAWAGAAVALAVSAKLSMVLALPFLLFYLFHNKRLRTLFSPFVLAGAGTLVLFWGPHMLSAGGRRMLFSNPEMGKVFTVALPMGDSVVYLLPLVYGLAVFGAWRVRRMSFDLLLVLLGIGFFLVLLFTPAAAGWFVWVVPFLVAYQMGSDRVAKGLVAAFGLLYVAFSLSMLPELAFLSINPWLSPSVLHTVQFTLGLILVSRMLRDGVQNNEYFRLSRRPFVLTIAGDSGAGKDTLADAVAGLFGEHSVVRVSGDNYHLWDRHKPMWQVMTHLNPRANDLVRFAQDVQSLVNGQAIHARHYDHVTGQLGKPCRLKSNDFVIVSGLHALYLPLVRALSDLTIYLDMDESLRRHLKIRRDVQERGHTLARVEAAFEQREQDARRFVRPQARYADLVLAVQPLRPELSADRSKLPRVKLVVRTRDSMYYEPMVRTLVGVCGLHVDMAATDTDGMLELIIEGETNGDDVAMAATCLLPQLTDLLDMRPCWNDGILGVMQLIVLVHIAQSLRARL